MRDQIVRPGRCLCVKSWLPCIAMALTLIAKAQAAESPSAFESNPDGWIEILPSSDLVGWSRVPVPPTGKLGRAQWHVASDQKVLKCNGDGGHDMLLWDRELGDAIFH